jgi:hypothetical protein
MSEINIKTYKLWLEERKYDKSKDFILSYLNLDSEKGMSLSLDGFDKNDLLQKIKNTNFYAELSERAREKIENILASDSSKTVGDLIRAATI